MFASPTFRRVALTLLLATLLPVGLLNARLDLERHWRASQERQLEDLRFPSPQWARLLSLNYHTLAADLMWFMLTVQHGQYVSYRNNAADNVLDNAAILARTDPHFYQVYAWASGAFLNRRYPITAEDLDRVADFLEIGINNHQNDAELRLSAALLYIGYGVFSDEVRARQSERALTYLDEAVRVAPDDLQIVAVRSFFRHRLEKLGGEAVADDQLDAEFWFSLLTSTSDPRIQKNATQQLKALGQYDEMVRGTFFAATEQHSADRPYVPFELWLLVREQESP